MKCHKTIVLFALDSYLSTLLFAQRFLSLVARERDILLPRAWKEFQLQINATDDSILANPNTNASKSRMLYKLLSLLERNADLDQSANSRSISTSWPTCDLLKRSIGPAKVPASSTETLYRSSKNRSVSLLSFSLFFSYALTRTVAHWTRIPVTKRRNRRGRMPGITPRGWPFQLSTFPPGVRIPPTHALDDPCKASLSPKGSPGSPL